MTCFGFLFIFQCLSAAPGAPPAVGYCDVARPIRWSRDDTRPTKEAADTENRKWLRFCPAKGA